MAGRDTGVAILRGGGTVGPFGHFFERLSSKAIEKLRVDGAYLRHHFADDGPGFAGGVGSGAHAPESMEHDAGNGVHHGSEGSEGKDVASDFDGALLRGALNFLNALGVGHGTDVPNVTEDFAGVGDENSGEFAIVLPGAGDGLFVDRASGGVEEQRLRRDVGLGAIEADISLALLLGIVKRMRVKEGPYELAGNILQAEFEMSVLKNRVMAAVERGGTDVEALLVGDSLGADQMRGVAGAGGGDGGIEGMGPGIAQRDAGRSGFDQFTRERIFEHAGLCGHYAENLTHESAEKRGV